MNACDRHFVIHLLVRPGLTLCNLQVGQGWATGDTPATCEWCLCAQEFQERQDQGLLEFLAEFTASIRE